jgi:hypothetical protein
MSEKKVVGIDFYTKDTIPQRLKDRVYIDPNTDKLIVVKIFCCPPFYSFELVGNKPEDIINYMRKLAKEDGVDLDKIVTMLE